MRRILATAVLCATLLPAAAACSNSPDGAEAGKSTPGSSSSPGAPAPGGSTGPSGAPASPGGSGTVVTGPSTDKAACEAISVKLGSWGAAFAEAASGLAGAGSDVKKVEVVVNKVKAANTQFAGELRTEGSKSKDTQVKKVADDLAGSLERINGQLDPAKVAQNPDALTLIFDAPEYAAAAENYEKLCGA